MRVMGWFLFVAVTATLLVTSLRGNSGLQNKPQNNKRSDWPQRLKQLKQYKEEGTVEHKPGTATVSSNDPRPLRQAISALNEEYGWTVDYEDPPYSSNSELIDVTDNQLRAAHPNSRRVTVPSGGAFDSTFQEDSTLNTSAGEARVLKQIVNDYNHSANPGKFLLRAQDGGRYTIIGSNVKDTEGKDKSVLPLLDTPISLTRSKRSALDTISLILQEVTGRTQVKTGVSWVPNNLLINTQITVGGDNVPARELLLEALTATGRPLVYYPDVLRQYANLFAEYHRCYAGIA